MTVTLSKCNSCHRLNGAWTSSDGRDKLSGAAVSNGTGQKTVLQLKLTNVTKHLLLFISLAKEKWQLVACEIQICI